MAPDLNTAAGRAKSSFAAYSQIAADITDSLGVGRARILDVLQMVILNDHLRTLHTEISDLRAAVEAIASVIEEKQ